DAPHGGDDRARTALHGAGEGGQAVGGAVVEHVQAAAAVVHVHPGDHEAGVQRHAAVRGGGAEAQPAGLGAFGALGGAAVGGRGGDDGGDRPVGAAAEGGRGVGEGRPHAGHGAQLGHVDQLGVAV